MSVRRTFATSNGMLLSNSPYIPWVVRGTALVSVFFMIPLNIITRNSLTDYEADFISWLQDYRSSSLNDFFRSVAFTGTHDIIVFVMPGLFNILEPVVTMKITVVSTHALYLYTLFAVILTEPRPYWIHSEIKGIDCVNGFGTPSEKVLFSMIFSLYLIIELFEGRLKKIYLAILYIAASIWVLMVSFAIVYLGENFMHQIFLTICIGYVYLTMVLLLDFYIVKLSLISCYYNNKNRLAKVYWFIAAISMVWVIIVFHMNIDKNTKISIRWIKNAYKDCSFDKDISGYYSFYQSSWVFYNLGAVYGAQVTSKYLPMNWWKTCAWKKVVRVLISGGSTYALYYGLNQIETYDAQTKFIFHYAINVFISGLFGFGALPIFFNKVHLNQKDDDEYQNVGPRSSFTGISLRSIYD
jgi:hypothetical protein